MIKNKIPYCNVSKIDGKQAIKKYLHKYRQVNAAFQTSNQTLELQYNIKWKSILLTDVISCARKTTNGKQVCLAAWPIGRGQVLLNNEKRAVKHSRGKQKKRYRPTAFWRKRL